jgi:Flagellar hook-length control protein FliK
MPEIPNRIQLILEKFLTASLVGAKDAAIKKDGPTLQLTPGQRVQAQVEASLPNGNLKILVANQSLQVTLPKNAAAGDTLDLVFVSHEPRPTFILRENTTPATSQSSVSSTGRFIASLLPQAADTANPPVVKGTAPILNAPTENVAQLASRLQQTLSQSGVFYESHQAQWVAGQRPLARLLLEPQAKLTPQRTALSPSAPYQTNSTEVSTQNVGTQPVNVPARAGAEGTTSTPAPEILAAAKDIASMAKVVESAINPNTHSMIQNQLHALETRQVAWHGEIWPGQWLEWEVSEHGEHHAESQEEKSWQTSLNLALPQLGDIRARLQFGAKGLHIQVFAASAETTALLKNNRSALQQALADINIPVLSMALDEHAQT